MKWTLAFGALVIVSALPTCAWAQAARTHEPEPPKEAVCVLVPTQGNQVAGTIVLTEEKGYVAVTGEVTGLKPGEHGFHIHMFGDLRSSKGTSAGGHYDADGHMHGGPDSKNHHAGDLGNIKANEQGVAKVNVKAEGLRVHFVLGRSLVVHADPDDFKTQPSGKSGDRVAVGVIGVAEVKTDAPAASPKK